MNIFYLCGSRVVCFLLLGRKAEPRIKAGNGMVGISSARGERDHKNLG